MPKEYQDLLTRLLTIQADCEIAGPRSCGPPWPHVAAFGMRIDKVGEYQLEEMNGSTYRPIEDYLGQILREEKGHISYGQQQLEKLVQSGDEGREQAQAAVDKWYTVGLDMFG